jgi:mannose-6-phosphate isomerase-like protein (cupin superfamily)
MPIIRGSQGEELSPQTRPEWCRLTSAGVFRVPAEGGRFDPHFHDCDEYWLIFKGRAKVRSEGRDFYVNPGDIVCTRTGDEHDFLEVYEDIEAFWLEESTPPGGRIGHLHRCPEKAKGHPVVKKPLPEDFPK